MELIGSLIIRLIGVKNNNVYAILIGIILLAGCKQNDKQFDYVYYSKKYCDCCTNNNTKLGPNKTIVFCDSILSNENRFFKAFKSNIEIDTFYKRYPSSLRDSTLIFMAGFSNYIYKNCPLP